MHIEAEHGTIDSPMNPQQVHVYDWVPQALVRLNKLGFSLAVATNQPAAAKLKTTKVNLENVHNLIIKNAEVAGGRISTSHICWHRAEDACQCRKPKTGLLEAAIDSFQKAFGREKVEIWMVGDGVTDIGAGQALGLQTAFLGPRKCDACKIFDERKIAPSFWGQNLKDFAAFLESKESPNDIRRELSN